MTEVQKNIPQDDEISLKELLQKSKEWGKYLLSKWLIILVFGLGGAGIGLAVAIFTKPKYKAHLSFALIEKSSGGGLADLASSFGIGGLGSSSSGTFSGDNLLEIIQSRYALEKTLLTPVDYKGEKKNLVEVYIQFNKLHEAWAKSTNKELSQLAFPVGQKRKTFTRTQDSVLYSIYDEILKSNTLLIARKDKKLSVVNMDYTTEDEQFSKLFVENLMDETYRFYIETRTSQSRANINTMEHTADSIKRLYESALERGAGYSQININPAMQYAAVPAIKQQNSAQLYATVYTEVLKNLETLKLDLSRETPIVQIIDTPRLPLNKERLGKAKAVVLGGVLGGFLIVFYLLGALFFKSVLRED